MVQRVAVTGYGFQTATGNDWSYFSRTESCKRPSFSIIPCSRGVSLPVLSVNGFTFERSRTKHRFDRLDSVNKLALFCSKTALNMAGLLDEQSGVSVGEPDVIFASTYSGSDVLLKNMEVYRAKGNRYLTPLMWSCGIYSSLSAVCREFQLNGYNSCVSSDMAAGYEALRVAYRRIQMGISQIVLVFGADPVGKLIAEYQALNQKGEWNTSGIPFDPDSNSFIPGEACAALVLESVASAERRQAPILGYIHGAGYCRRSRSRYVDNNSIYQAIRNALEDQYDGEVDFVYSGANGCPERDKLEKDGVDAYFQNKSPKGILPVASMKYFWGESFGSADILNLIVSLHTLNTKFWPKSDEIERTNWEPLRLRQSVAPKAGLLCGSDMFGNGHALVVTKEDYPWTKSNVF